MADGSLFGPGDRAAGRLFTRAECQDRLRRHMEAAGLVDPDDPARAVLDAALCAALFGRGGGGGGGGGEDGEDGAGLGGMPTHMSRREVRRSEREKEKEKERVLF